MKSTPPTTTVRTSKDSAQPYAKHAPSISSPAFSPSVSPSLARNLAQESQSHPPAAIQRLTPREVMTLQRTVGNQVVQRILAKQPHAPATRDVSQPSAQSSQTESPTTEPATAEPLGHKTMIQRKPKGLGKRLKNWFGGRKARVQHTKLLIPIESESEYEESDAERTELDIDSSAGGSEGSSSSGVPEKNARTIAHFLTRYNVVVGKHDRLHKDIGYKLSEFATTTQDFELTDYSDQVLGNEKVQTLLQQIQEHLDTKDSDGELFSELISDMLLFASLVPTSRQDHGKMLGRQSLSYLTAQVLTLQRVIEILVQLAQQAAMGQEANAVQSLKGIDFDDKDSVAQRMLKMSLANMTKTARQHLQGTELFKKMLESPEIINIILGSGGVFEQDFLNTCAAAAVNKEVQVNASNIASLLMVGRGVTDYIEATVNEGASQEKPGKGLKKTHKRGLFKKTSVGQHALNRINEARQEFDEIEAQATIIVSKQPVDVAALHSLMARWNRIMQKLAAVTDLEKGNKSVRVLSKKRVKDQWMTSAVIAVLMGTFLDRPRRRTKGVNTTTYRLALSENLNISTAAGADAKEKYNDPKGGSGNLKDMSTAWSKIFQMGGTELSVPGHSLYLQAIVQDGKPMFLVSDPKISKSHLYTLEELETFARKTRKGNFKLRSDFDEIPKGYLLEDNVPLYTKPHKLGDKANEEGDIVMLERRSRIITATEETRDNKLWAKVRVETKQGIVDGRIARDKIQFLS